MKYCVVLSTAANQTEADKIAEVLLKNHIAACVQFVPISSCYWWNGNIEHANEIQMFIKTTDELYNRVQEEIRKNHSYDVPEIVKIPIDSGLPEYLGWISKETIA